MAYDATQFTADAVKELLTLVTNGVADNTLDLEALIQDLREIRFHTTYLLHRLEDRREEVEFFDEEEGEE